MQHSHAQWLQSSGVHNSFNSGIQSSGVHQSFHSGLQSSAAQQNFHSGYSSSSSWPSWHSGQQQPSAQPLQGQPSMMVSQPAAVQSLPAQSPVVVGTAVQVQRQGLWWGGRVTYVHANKTVAVRYDDGSTEDGIAIQFIRVVSPQPLSAGSGVWSPQHQSFSSQVSAANQPQHQSFSQHQQGVSASGMQFQQAQQLPQQIPQRPPLPPAQQPQQLAPSGGSFSVQQSKQVQPAPAQPAPAQQQKQTQPTQAQKPEKMQKAGVCGLNAGARNAAQEEQEACGSGDEECEEDEDEDDTVMHRLSSLLTTNLLPKPSELLPQPGFFGRLSDGVHRTLIEPALQKIGNIHIDMNVETPKDRDAHLDGLSVEYSEAAIHAATKGFDKECLLGSGAFGSVYKGTTKDGTEVAIKTLKNMSPAGFEEEVKVLSRFRHPNLVILVGFTRHSNGDRSLIYEYLAGGDVSHRLKQCRMRAQPFDAKLRVSVALDAASGLAHLHCANPRAFHRDIKCANILLDKNGTAKMADFGLACVSQSSEHKVMMASGTSGYACAQYVRTGIVTEGSEVHSFGIVMLELITGMPPAVRRRDDSGEMDFLVERVRGDPDKVMDFLDPTADFQLAHARTLAEIALLCIMRAPADRPLFVQLVEVLREMQNFSEPRPEAAKKLLQWSTRAVLQPIRESMDVDELATQESNVHTAPPPRQRSKDARDAPDLATVDNNVQFAPRASVGRGDLATMDNNVQVAPSAKSGGDLATMNNNVQVAPSASVDRELQTMDNNVQVASLAVGESEVAAMESNVARIPRPLSTALNNVQVPPLQPSQGDTGRCSATMSTMELDLDILAEKCDEGLSPSHGSARCTLSCVYAQNVDLSGVDDTQRSVFFPKVGDELIFGRAVQSPSLWTGLVPNELDQQRISREHAKIISRRTSTDCDEAFFLQCLSTNGLLLNDMFVENSSSEHPLHNGDIISFASNMGPKKGAPCKPFVAFVFRTHASGHDRSTSKESVCQLPEDAHVGRWWRPEQVSLEVPDATIAALEVFGENVYMELPKEARQIFFCYDEHLLRTCTESALPQRLRLGRHHQRGFWKLVLEPEFYAEDCWAFLATDHFELCLVWPQGQTNEGERHELLYKVRALCEEGLTINKTVFLTLGDEQELRAGDVLEVGHLHFMFASFTTEDVRTAENKTGMSGVPRGISEAAVRFLPDDDMAVERTPQNSGVRFEASLAAPESPEGPTLRAGVLMVPVDLETEPETP